MEKYNERLDLSQVSTPFARHCSFYANEKWFIFFRPQETPFHSPFQAFSLTLRVPDFQPIFLNSILRLEVRHFPSKCAVYHHKCLSLVTFAVFAVIRIRVTLPSSATSLCDGVHLSIPSGSSYVWLNFCLITLRVIHILPYVFGT